MNYWGPVGHFTHRSKILDLWDSNILWFLRKSKHYVNHSPYTSDWYIFNMKYQIIFLVSKKLLWGMFLQFKKWKKLETMGVSASCSIFLVMLFSVFIMWLRLSKSMCKPHYGYQDFSHWPMGFTLWQTSLCNGNCPTTDPITKMGVAYAFARTYLQPHYGIGVFCNVYLSAGQH